MVMLSVGLPCNQLLLDMASSNLGVLLRAEQMVASGQCGDGFLVVAYEHHRDVLLLYRNSIHSAARHANGQLKRLPVIDFFREFSTTPARHVQLGTASAGLVLLVAVSLESAPAIKVDAGVANLEQILDGLRSRGQSAAVQLLRDNEHNLVYCRDGEPVSAFFANASTAPHESSVRDQILAYCYASPANTAVEVYYALDTRRDEHATRRFQDLAAGKVGPPPLLLSLHHGEERVQKRLIHSGKALVGRDPANDIVVDHLSVSRHHCTIEWVKSAYVMRDAGSANGTTVNDRRVAEATLVPGDRIGVGEFVLHYGGDGERETGHELQTMFVENAVHGGHPHLLVEGAPVAIDRPVFTFGSSPHANLRLRGWFVKPIQATLIQDGSGTYRLLPVSGGRKVQVNGRVLGPSGVVLESGSQIVIAGRTVVFVLAAQGT